LYVKKKLVLKESSKNLAGIIHSIGVHFTLLERASHDYLTLFEESGVRFLFSFLFVIFYTNPQQSSKCTINPTANYFRKTVKIALEIRVLIYLHVHEDDMRRLDDSVKNVYRESLSHQENSFV